jgi:hypothetical protein
MIYDLSRAERQHRAIANEKPGPVLKSKRCACGKAAPAKVLVQHKKCHGCQLFTELSLANVYDYELHVGTGEQMLANKSLPATYMSLAPGSSDPMVWHDIVRMKTLNGAQAARAVENHVCPFQIDIVDRLIGRYTNPGDVVYDPFHGLGTVGVRAVKLARKGRGSELNAAYFRDQVHYLKEAEREASMPTLFDLVAPRRQASPTRSRSTC